MHVHQIISFIKDANSFNILNNYDLISSVIIFVWICRLCKLCLLYWWASFASWVQPLFLRISQKLLLTQGNQIYQLPEPIVIVCSKLFKQGLFSLSLFRIRNFSKQLLLSHFLFFSYFPFAEIYLNGLSLSPYNFGIPYSSWIR